MCYEATYGDSTIQVLGDQDHPCPFFYVFGLRIIASLNNYQSTDRLSYSNSSARGDHLQGSLREGATTNGPTIDIATVYCYLKLCPSSKILILNDQQLFYNIRKLVEMSYANLSDEIVAESGQHVT